MAHSTLRYNHTLQKLTSGGVNLANCKLMLLNNTATFDATHTQLAQVAGAGNAKQVSGNGWAAGGPLVTFTFTTASTNGVIIDINDVVVGAVGGQIGPAYAAVLYDDLAANDPPLWWLGFDPYGLAAQSSDFKIILPDGLSALSDA